MACTQQQLDQWRASATAGAGRARGGSCQPAGRPRQDRRRIKELERELLRKDRALAETAALLVLSKKVEAIFNNGRGRMIGLEDRQALARESTSRTTAGARLHLACEIAGIDLRTLQRWKASDGLVEGDGRPLAVRATAGPCPERRPSVPQS